MYAELLMKLKGSTLDYRKTSNLQGIIMEHIDSEYAQKLHHNSLNPYSQYLQVSKENVIWHISAISQEAYEQIILPMSYIDEIYVKKKNEKIEVQNREIKICRERELLREFYEVSGSRYLNLRFMTPTAFKQNGKYIFWPDLRLIYGSLMRRYSASSEGLEMVDENTLEELVTKSEIVRYNIRSVSFPLEGIKITGFCGTICIHVAGTDTMARYARMLFRFGKYSGVGIKTAMGMGAMELMERRQEQ